MVVSIITCNEHKVATAPTFYDFDHGTSPQSAVTTGTHHTAATTAGATLLRPALKALMTNCEHTRHSCGRAAPWDCRVLMDSQRRAEGGHRVTRCGCLVCSLATLPLAHCATPAPAFQRPPVTLQTFATSSDRVDIICLHRHLWSCKR